MSRHIVAREGQYEDHQAPYRSHHGCGTRGRHRSLRQRLWGTTVTSIARLAGCTHLNNRASQNMFKDDNTAWCNLDSRQVEIAVSEPRVWLGSG